MTLPVERVGLLFVHGIGQQERFEFLRDSVHELSELLLQGEPKARITVTDRTAGWTLPAGEVDPRHAAPISLDLTSGTRHTVFDCHEVWWADLGERSGLLDSITFWLWGLGQWCAPIYRVLDASGIRKSKTITAPGHPNSKYNKPVSTLTKLPLPPGSIFWTQLKARLLLVLTALNAAFLACSWSLLKRVAASVAGKAPSPTIIVQYVGDVRTFEERAAPGQTNLSDPGHPRRVAIRRRMVTEMVAMGADTRLKRWYVLGHSLGSIVAYNGLTEIGHTLPNYLPEAQWNRLGGWLQRDTNCDLRPKTEMSAMMPSRPPWLAYSDVVNRNLLFGRFEGLITYGSPLNKFASLWPRVVATATDRKDGETPFPGRSFWLNIAAPADPVGGPVNSFEIEELKKSLPPAIVKIRSGWSLLYVLAHIRYFSPVEGFDNSGASQQKRDIVRCLLDNTLPRSDDGMGAPRQHLVNAVIYTVLTAVLWLATTAVVTLAGGLKDIVTGEKAPAYATWSAFADAFQANLGLVVAAVLTIVLGFGLWRWMSESWLNLHVARKQDDYGDPDNKASMLRRLWFHIVISSIFSTLTAGSLMFFLTRAPVDEWLTAALFTNFATCAGRFPYLDSALTDFAIIVAAALAQSLIDQIALKPGSRVSK